MKLSKHELKQIADIYMYHENDKDSEFMDGFKIALIYSNTIREVRNEVFKRKHKRATEQIETVLTLCKKARATALEIELQDNLLDAIADDIPYMQRLDEDEKRALRGSIDYILNY